MVDRNGFLFVEVLMGLFILGIIAVTCLPLISTSLDNMRLTRTKAEMVFLAESAMERLINFDQNHKNNEYIFDIPLCDLIRILAIHENTVVVLPLDDAFNCDYRLKIYKYSFTDKLWKIHIELSSVKEGEKVENIILRSIIPSKDYNE